jgi:cGMP-dependent protein kinase 2
MYERPVPAGEILIQEGETGLGASELYVVKEGEFEVLQRMKGVNLRVNMKRRGDTFGELSLMYDCPRSATVAATQDAVVWVLERDVFRQHVRKGQEDAASQLELFLNQVPILSPLSKIEKLKLLDAFEEKTYAAGETVVHQGEIGDLFYVIKDGEATVLQHDDQELQASVAAAATATAAAGASATSSSTANKNDEEEGIPGASGSSSSARRVNQLFRSDFFGETSLLTSAPRTASVVAVTQLVCLTLDRENFISVLGPLEQLMAREKSPHVVGARLMKLASLGGPSRQQAMVHIKRRRYSKSQGQWVWELVRSVGHLDEVLELKSVAASAGALDNTSNLRSTPSSPLASGGGGGGTASFGDNNNDSHSDDRLHPVLTLVEGVVLGSGAFSRVSVVTEEGSPRAYALKRMRKTAVAQCPEHIFCEQAITRNLTHPFCIRQYGSFQDKYHLYFLFDLMPGGDLMDVLVAEARIVAMRVPKGPFQRGCMAPQTKFLRGLPENVARFYIASIVLALEYLHDHNIVYRDLKPENVFIDQQGYPKLGDFGFAKVLDAGKRTYTFCGTPGYVAPENILAHGYGISVDWWGLGVVMFVLLTGRQPFTSPKNEDPMVVMRRIVDEEYAVKFPPYITPAAKDLVSRLLERKPTRRLGALAGRAGDVKRHKWFDGFDWEALSARKMVPPRQPKDDAAKRIRDLATQERKHGARAPKETPEELMEANKVFEDF